MSQKDSCAQPVEILKIKDVRTGAPTLNDTANLAGQKNEQKTSRDVMRRISKQSVDQHILYVEVCKIVPLDINYIHPKP